MRKLILNILLLSLGILLFFPLLSFAQTNIVITPPGPTGLVDYIDAAKTFLWILVAPLSTVMLIWAGILFVTSEGDPEKAKKARTLVTYVVIGIFVALVATGLSLLLTEIFS